MNVISEITGFIEEWIRSAIAAQDAIKTKDLSALRDHIPLQNVDEGNNFVNRAGYQHLKNAARLLLRAEDLEQKLELRTAMDAVVQAHFALLPTAKRKNKFSEAGIADRARRALRAAPRSDGTYVYPVVFAPGAITTDWGFGPVRIVSKKVLLDRYKDALDEERTATADPLRLRLVSDWEEHSESYDHFVLVNIEGHEHKPARHVGREVAEFLLNLIRMFFGYYHTDDIRIGGGYIFETKQSSLYFDSAGKASFSSSRGPFGTQLDDRWAEAVERSLGQMVPMFASYLNWFVAGNDPKSPILERIRYASMLIAEAYAEPFDHIRLVRFVSALEALALAGREDIAHSIALHCGYVGGRGNINLACEIYDAVRFAYKVRSKIVHGEMPVELEIQEAFLKLERFALDLVVAFVCFFENIHTLDRPQSIQQLRRIVKRRACMFFWMPEIATN